MRENQEAPIAHLHERGIEIPTLDRRDLLAYRCQHCGAGWFQDQWIAYKAAIADVEANGMPDHERRVGLALEELRRMGHVLHPSDVKWAIQTYLRAGLDEPVMEIDAEGNPFIAGWRASTILRDPRGEYGRVPLPKEE